MPHANEVARRLLTGAAASVAAAAAAASVFVISGGGCSVAPCPPMPPAFTISATIAWEPSSSSSGRRGMGSGSFRETLSVPPSFAITTSPTATAAATASVRSGKTGLLSPSSVVVAPQRRRHNDFKRRRGGGGTAATEAVVVVVWGRRRVLTRGARREGGTDGDNPPCLFSAHEGR